MSAFPQSYCSRCGSSDLAWYDGALGYEALKCRACGTEHTNDRPAITSDSPLFNLIAFHPILLNAARAFVANCNATAGPLPPLVEQTSYAIVTLAQKPRLNP